jgi:hypothetical protein
MHDTSPFDDAYKRKGIEQLIDETKLEYSASALPVFEKNMTYKTIFANMKERVINVITARNIVLKHASERIGAYEININIDAREPEADPPTPQSGDYQTWMMDTLKVLLSENEIRVFTHHIPETVAVSTKSSKSKDTARTSSVISSINKYIDAKVVTQEDPPARLMWVLKQEIYDNPVSMEHFKTSHETAMALDIPEGKNLDMTEYMKEEWLEALEKGKVNVSKFTHKDTENTFTLNQCKGEWLKSLTRSVEESVTNFNETWKDAWTINHKLPNVEVSVNIIQFDNVNKDNILFGVFKLEKYTNQDNNTVDYRDAIELAKWICSRDDTIIAKMMVRISRLSLATYSTHAYSTHAYSTHAYSTHAYSTHAYSTHAYSTHAYRTHAYSTHAYSTHAYSTHAYSTHAYSTHAYSTHAYSTHAYSIHTHLHYTYIHYT